jgi:hypothetical protein
MSISDTQIAGPVLASKIRRTGSALPPIESGKISSLGLFAAIDSLISSMCAPNTLSPPR